MTVSLRVALTTILVTGLPLIASGVARADTGSLPGGATIMFNRLFLHEVANPKTNGGVDPAEPLKLPDSLWTYFNYAHCVCDEPSNRTVTSADATDPAHHESTFGYELLLQNRTVPIHQPLHFFVGTGCDTPDLPTRNAQCTELTTTQITDIDSLYPTGSSPEIHLFDLMTPAPAENMAGKCQQRSLDATEWIAADVGSDGTADGTLDYFQAKVINTDSLPPPVPTEFTVSGGENAITLNWKMPVGDNADTYYYQALCVDPNGDAAREPAADPLYMTPHSLCGAAETISFIIVTPETTLSSNRVPFAGDGGIDAPVDAPLPIDAAGPPDSDMSGIPANIRSLDGAFICGSTAVATATSMRIDGLTNGVAYRVALLAIDKFGNPAGAYINTTITPQPVTDFWEDLHGRGSHVEGGFCLINDTFGDDSGISSQMRAFRDETLASTAFGRWLTAVYYEDFAGLGEYVQGSAPLRVFTAVNLAPAIALALAWHYLTLPGLLGLVLLCGLARNRRRVLARRSVRVAIASAGALVAMLGAPHHASAQVDPYWEHADGTTDPDLAEAPALVKWHAGIRVGPYTPQIDAQLGGPSPGPYKEMFGGYAILPMLDLERVVWRHRFGQVALGGSVGYMSKSANAWVDGSTPGDPNRMRAGDTNSFTLIPVAATASYRLTYFDDEYNVPVLPYARGGLAYDIWWVSGPGSIATVCKDSGTEPTCAQNKGEGASLGLTMSIGLAVRAERLDRDAASAMRDSGILHAGFYAELSLAKVDGFGSATKLSVGDNTFFGGVDFEF